MINPPPDPVATLEAEQRADDDGMPEHPAKAANPVGWADTLEVREKEHAAGYPTSPLGQAAADVLHGIHRLIDRIRPARPVTTLSTVAAVGVGIAVYLLFIRNDRYHY